MRGLIHPIILSLSGFPPMTKHMILGLCALVLSLSSSTQAQSNSQGVSVPFFGNKLCPVTGKATKPSLSVKVGDERVYVCCKGCLAKVKAHPKAFYAKAYPKGKEIDLKNPKCPIMGGKAKASVTTTFQGHLIHFCCPGCDKSFRKEPRKHLARLTHKGKLTDRNNKICPVMTDEKVKPDNFVIYKNQIINICCGGCADDFAKAPEKYLAALEKAEKKGSKKKGHGGHDHDHQP